MATDLEAQLRSVGHALDSRTSPVPVGEVIDRTRHRDSVAVASVAPVVLTAGERQGRWVLLAATAAVLVVGMIGSIAVHRHRRRSSRSPRPAR